MGLQLKQQFREIQSLINQAQNILIACHEKPDGDAVGSSLALYHTLKKRGLDTYCFAPDSPSDYLAFLPSSSVFQTNLPKKKIDLIFALDYGKPSRLGEALSLMGEDVRVISIDHHPRQDQIGDVILVAPEFSSTCEILYYFFQSSSLRIDRDVANCLLCGIFTDTGGFRHVVTSPRTLRAVSCLIGTGANVNKIAKYVFQGKTTASLKVWGTALSKVKCDSPTDMAYSWVSYNDLQYGGMNMGDLDGLPEVINTVSNSRFSLLLSEYEPGKIYGRLRSEAFKKVDVSKIARKLGGGGHKYAAAFRVEGTLKEVLDNVREIVRDTAR